MLRCEWLLSASKLREQVLIVQTFRQGTYTGYDSTRYSSVADPDPGLGTFLTPGSGIRDGRKSASGSGIRDPG